MNSLRAIAVGFCLFGLSSPALLGDETKFTAEQLKFFEAEVLPILKSRCIKCHGGGEKINGNLKLNSRAAVLKGGDTGPAVSLDAPEKSLLLDAINYGSYEMPPSGKLPAAEIDILTKWVKGGLPWSADAPAPKETTDAHGPPQVNEQNRRHWAFQPVRRPPVPAVKNAGWIENPIDAFLLAKLEAEGRSPAPSAEKRALVRRAYYDLWGLPPSPAEVDAFVSDAAPDAYEKLVDRLLASPHYGEKWARHWLDLVRYAESNSYERDDPKPHVWRYRDYVIGSLNDDKPYDQFIIEQLGGDELPDGSGDALIATGYYRLGIWDDEPSDPEQALYDDLDDIASTTSQVFLGLTVGCARCHDHKLDPIPQADYYRFLAFFSGLNRYGVRGHDTVERFSLRTIGTRAAPGQEQAAIEAHNRKVQVNARKLKEIEAIVKQDFAPVEHEDFQTENARLDIVKKHVPKALSEERFREYEALTKERDRLRQVRPASNELALCVTEIGPKPREQHVLIRGNPHVHGDKVEPAFPSILTLKPAPLHIKPTETTSGRRLALARWIGSSDNPLAARVQVNRLWQFHFGRGIVDSPNNFGLKGTAPTHPELLDWLASEFVSQGWRMKPLHRLMMLSQAYRMSSQSEPAALAADPENRLFWRFNMRRLNAEEVRDSLLAVNGSLNTSGIGGPSIYPTIPAEVLAGQSRPGAGWGRSSPEEAARRSIYIHRKRSLLMPILESFDAPDPDSSCPVRFATTQPTQALGLLNSQFLGEQSAVFARLLRDSAGKDETTQIRFALQRVLQRSPTDAEVSRGQKLLADLRRNPAPGNKDPLECFCLVVLNLNEFLYLD